MRLTLRPFWRRGGQAGEGPEGPGFLDTVPVPWSGPAPVEQAREQYARALAGLAARPADPIALAVAIPFCAAHCLYCERDIHAAQPAEVIDAYVESLLAEGLDGVMVGREAYHHPWLMADWDASFLGAEPVERSREEVEAAMVDYMERQSREGEPWSRIARHMLGLWNGQPGARRWRQVWSDHKLKAMPPSAVAGLATQARRHPAVAEAAA